MITPLRYLQRQRTWRLHSEERFSLKKHGARFPGNAISYRLSEAGVKLQDIDQVVFYDKPLVKFERLLETYFDYTPKSFRSFIATMPI